jgi:hypothetical protein
MKYYFLALGVIVAVCVGCAGPLGPGGAADVFDKGEYAAPPAGLVNRPGPMVAGPGPGVLNWRPPQPQAPAGRTTQVRFVAPRSMRVGWQVGTGFAENQVVVPGRYNFPQGMTYRLKLTGIAGREGDVFYPTLQLYPATPGTDSYLTHNSIPIELTIEDLDQIAAGNFVTKVIYLPEPKFQDLAIGDVETLVSTRLAPGVDPVVEAEKRGTIMAVLRVGNMDYEMPQSFGSPMAKPGAQLPPGGGQGAAAGTGLDGGLGVPPLNLPPNRPGSTTGPMGPLGPAGPMNPATPGAPGTPGANGEPPTGPIMLAPGNGVSAAARARYIQQVQFEQQQQAANGSSGQFVPPTPIASMNPPSNNFGVPGAMMVAGPGAPPGLPAMHPIAGMGPIEPWGYTHTGTPIGLPGPNHLPYGRPASLQSHTVVNHSKNAIPDPVDHFVLEVEHKPGFRLPPPVSHVEYTETHPIYNNGATSWPRWTGR